MQCSNKNGQFSFFSVSCCYKLMSVDVTCVLSLQDVCVFGVIIQVVAVYGSLEDLLSVASSKLGIRASSVYNGNGGLIDDISLIRWDFNHGIIQGTWK